MKHSNKKHLRSLDVKGYAHWVMLIAVIVVIGAAGSYALHASHAATANLSSSDCQLLGRPYGNSTCQPTCLAGAGSYVTSATTAYPYCSGAVSPSVQGTSCTGRGRKLVAGNIGCARRWQQTNLVGAIQCIDNTATYTVTTTTDYCAAPPPPAPPTTPSTPPSSVYTLPSTAPQPTALAAQPAAVGTGANPVVTTISDATWSSMMASNTWHTGCPVGRSQLSYMTVNYWGFDGYSHRGELVFAASKNAAFVSAFTKIYNNKIPLHGMYLVGKFGASSITGGADDYASMQHDNTSAFNCRWVDGKPGTLSPHAYGTAVDINPYENPYDSAQGWVPNQWWATHNYPPYTWRNSTDPMVQLMSGAGFNWTYTTEDAQHFDAR